MKKLLLLLLPSVALFSIAMPMDRVESISNVGDVNA